MYNISKFKTNSNFFFSNNINIDYFEDFFVTNIHLKSINQKNLENLLTGVTSSVNLVYLYLSTAKGDFLFTGLSNHLKSNTVLDFVKCNSNESNSFYFESNDNDISSRFAFAQNGTLVKFISNNVSESEDPDSEIEWLNNAINSKNNADFSNYQEGGLNIEMIGQLVDYFLPFVFDNVEIKKITLLHKSDSKIKLSESLSLDLFKKRHINKLSTNNISSAFSKLNSFNTNDFFITIDINKTHLYIHSFLLSELSESLYLFLNIAGKIDKTDDYIAYHFHNDVVSIIDEIKNAEIKDIGYISRFIRKIPNNTKRFILSFEFIKQNKFVVNLIHFPQNYPNTIYTCNKFNVKTSKEILDFIINLSPMDYV